MAQGIESPGQRRQVVIVAGAGRSGTSTVSGTLNKLGYHVPQPEVAPNKSNPRGFFEPRWVVNFHQQMLSAADSTALDSRPEIAVKLRKIADGPKFRDQLRNWLPEHLEVGNLVIKDPRTLWFRELWVETVSELGAEVKFLTMLRHPAEVVGSRDTYYQARKTPQERAIGEIANLAGWINCTLVNEYGTRGSPRVFLTYAELLADWRSAMATVAQKLEIAYTSDIAVNHHPVDDFIDVGLRRVRATWDDMVVPTWLQELAESIWQILTAGKENTSTAASYEELDAIRKRYARMYSDSVALSRDHTKAAVRAARRQTRRKVSEEFKKKERERNRADSLPTDQPAEAPVHPDESGPPRPDGSPVDSTNAPTSDQSSRRRMRDWFRTPGALGRSRQ